MVSSQKIWHIEHLHYRSMMSLNREESILPWYMPYLFCAVKDTQGWDTMSSYCVLDSSIHGQYIRERCHLQSHPNILLSDHSIKTKFCRTKPSTHIFFFFLWQNNHCKFHVVVVVVVVERDADENGSWIKEKKEEKIFLDTFKIFDAFSDIPRPPYKLYEILRLSQRGCSDQACARGRGESSDLIVPLTHVRDV